MSKTTTTIDQDASLSLPPEALEALGVEAGSELDVAIVGRAVVVRSVEEACRSREFIIHSSPSSTNAAAPTMN
jgi:hypothetical protein